MELTNQNVLVTGATGMVGQNLLSRLVAEGARIRAVKHTTEPIVMDPAIQYIQGDLTTESDCHAAVQGIDYVFHCAANTSGAAITASTPMAHVTPNVVMNALLLEAAYLADVKKFMWLSSTTGYPLSGDHPVQEHEILEGEPFEKYFFVGWMKRYTEILCQTYGEKLPKTMTTIVLRPSNVYGPGDDFDPRTSHSTAALVRRVAERQIPMDVWGDGTDVKDLVYVDDFIDAMILAIKQVESYTAFNIGSGIGYSIKDVVDTLIEIDGFSDARINYDPTKPTMIPIRLMNISKARTQLGYNPTTSLKDGLQRTLNWYRESNNIAAPSGTE